MLKYILITIGILLAIIVVGFFFFINQEPNLSQFEYLKTPQITNKANQKVILVKAFGEPEKTTAKAFKLLFNTYYKIKGVPKYPLPAPRARWFAEPNTPENQWAGYFAIPIPDNIKKNPEINDNSGLTIEITTWEYGDVAEILYIGPYDKEVPTIEKLTNFIKKSGYEIAGPHEEEYLKGPSLFFHRDPKNFLTIIRYQIKKIIKN
jgi:hypothetical protein